MNRPVKATAAAPKKPAPTPRRRCPWAESDPLCAAYHDQEWGVPSHDDRYLFELLNLEGAQAGLSWAIILRKREGYRQAFADWDPGRIARFDERDLARLLADPGIVRHRLKVQATVANARAFLALQRRPGDFARHLWQFAPAGPRRRPRHPGEVAARSPAADALSRDLQQRGFRFVGPTICHAFMQAAGMVDDHLTTCFRARG